MTTCLHHWSMTGVFTGYLIGEGCPHCGGRHSYFASEEPGPQADEYRDGPHLWSYLGSFQSIRFHLRCEVCGRDVNLDNMGGLMLSTCEDPQCPVGRLVTSTGGNAAVYVALCDDTSHASGTCVSGEGIAALTEYFNQRVRPRGKQIVVVPCRMCNHVENCDGVMLADTV